MLKFFNFVALAIEINVTLWRTGYVSNMDIDHKLTGGFPLKSFFVCLCWPMIEMLPLWERETGTDHGSDPGSG